MNFSRHSSRSRRRRPGLHVESLESRLALSATGWEEMVRAAAAVRAGEPAAVTAVAPAFVAAIPAAAATTVTVTAAGAPFVHELASPYQRTTTRLRVLVPDTYDASRTYRTVYVLPVEPGNGTKYGDGLRVIQNANLHNLHDAVFVAPSFSDMPWYGDHPTQATIRQESHFLDVVIPFVEGSYSVSRQPADRLLLGFSKSGYGAFSMLLRHPDRLGKAVAWDAPLTLTAPRSDWGMPKIFGSNANFGNYRVTRLIDRQAPLLATGPARLILAGSNTFRGAHTQVQRQLAQAGVPHVVGSGPRYAHSWGSGWVPSAVRLVLA